MKYLAFLLAFSLLPLSSVYGQGAKTLKRNKVASQTIHEYFVKEGIAKPVVEKIETYDTLGNVVEIKEFNSKSEVKKWQKFSFNEHDDLLEEITLGSNGKTQEKIVYEYDKDRLIKEKIYYDNRDRIVKRKKYKYTYHPEKK